jgi:hypothetical protein
MSSDPPCPRCNRYVTISGDGRKWICVNYKCGYVWKAGDQPLIEVIEQ